MVLLLLRPSLQLYLLLLFRRYLLPLLHLMGSVPATASAAAAGAWYLRRHQRGYHFGSSISTFKPMETHVEQMLLQFLPLLLSLHSLQYSAGAVAALKSGVRSCLCCGTHDTGRRSGIFWSYLPSMGGRESRKRLLPMKKRTGRLPWGPQLYVHQHAQW